jgi:hypothetical protein
MTTMTEIRGSVQVTAEFFAGILRDYSDWLLASVREYVQNGVDNGARNVHFKTFEQEGNVWLVASNDGNTMSLVELQTKLLSLGGTSKVGKDTAGGFGRAKELLYFSQKEYRIRSGEYFVSGSGAQYTITEQDYFDGTESTVALAEAKSNFSKITIGEVANRVYRIAEYTTLPGVITINGEQCPKMNSRKVLLEENDVFKLYRIPKHQTPGYIVVRHNGVPMFAKQISGCKHTLFAELKLPSVDVLTTSRDGFKGGYAIPFEKVVEKFLINKSSAGREITARPKLRINAKAIATGFVRKFEPVVREAEPKQKTEFLHKHVAQTTEAIELDDDYVPQKLSDPRPWFSADRYSLSLRCECERLPKERYWRYNKVCKPVAMLLSRWARLLGFFQSKLEVAEFFEVGLVFSDTVGALFIDDTGINTYLVNPTKKGKLYYNAKTYHELPAIALHEITHIGHKWHDEDFASKFTSHAAMLTKYSVEVRRILRSNDILDFNFPDGWSVC